MNGQISTQFPDTAVMNESDLFDIAITGIGIVTPLGLGCSVNLERLLAGDSAVKNEVPAGVASGDSIPSGRCIAGGPPGGAHFARWLAQLSG